MSHTEFNLQFAPTRTIWDWGFGSLRAEGGAGMQRGVWGRAPLACLISSSFSFVSVQRARISSANGPTVMKRTHSSCVSL